MNSYIVVKPFSRFELDYGPGEVIILWPSDAQPLLANGYLANISQQRLEAWRTNAPIRNTGGCNQCSRPK